MLGMLKILTVCLNFQNKKKHKKTQKENIQWVLERIVYISGDEVKYHFSISESD